MKQYSKIRSEVNHDNVKIEHPINLADNITLARHVSLGRFSYVSSGTRINSGTEIGRFCSIACGCELGVPNHPTSWLSTHPFQYGGSQFSGYDAYNNVNKIALEQPKPTKIGNDVWIGAQVVISRGVTIGDGAVIAAKSMVNVDVPPYAVVGGVPARIIRLRFPAETIVKLQELKWWELPIEDLSNIKFDEINLAISQIEDIKNKKRNEA